MYYCIYSYIYRSVIVWYVRGQDSTDMTYRYRYIDSIVRSMVIGVI